MKKANITTMTGEVIDLDKPNEFTCCGCEVLVIDNYIRDNPNANFCEDCPHVIITNDDLANGKKK